MSFFTKKRIILLSVLLIIVLCFATVYFGTTKVVTKKISVFSDKLSPVFNGYKIALITDFHNSNNYGRIISATANGKPEIIVIVGDIASMNDTDYTNVQRLADGLTAIAPTYFVSGNHERWSVNSDTLLSLLEKHGVNVINNKIVSIKYKSQSFNLVGFEDMIYSDNDMRLNVLEESFNKLYNKLPDDTFNLLLFHRANYIDNVAKEKIDLILSGHTHGGEINLPYVRDAILKARSINGQYIKGYYRKNDSQIIVSGGCGGGLKAPRLFNNPEVVMVTLSSRS